MEIVPLITYILLFAVALLVIVLGISILFSKAYNKNERGGQDLIPLKMEVVSPKTKISQSIVPIPKNTKPISSRSSQIFYLNIARTENRKSFSTQINKQQSERNTFAAGIGQTRLRSKQRYTIVNDTYGITQYSSINQHYDTQYNYMRASNFTS